MPLTDGQPPTPDAQPTVDATGKTLTPADIAKEKLRQSLTTLPLTGDELTKWWDRIEQSQQRTRERETEWDALWSEYLPTVSTVASPEDVKVNAHFRNVHTKMGQLFVQSPEVRLVAKGPGKETMLQPPMPGPDGMMQPPRTLRAEDGIAIRQAVINEYMGPDYIDAASLMDECLLDMQTGAGFAAVRVSYKATIRTAPAINDPQTGAVQREATPVPIYECWEAERVNPRKVLFDERLASCRIEKHSRWVGEIFFPSKLIAKRTYGLNDEELGQGGQSDDRIYRDAKDTGNEGKGEDRVKAFRIWYKAEHFMEADDHPQRIIELVLFDCCKDRPVVHRRSMDQTFDEQDALTENSLEGFPIIIGSLRPTMDSPFTKSDSAFTQAEVKQLNTHRQQMVKLRDAAIGMLLYDSGMIDEADKNRIQSGEVGAMIALKAGSLGNGKDKVMASTAQVQSTADDWRTDAMLESDLEKTLGISAVQTGGSLDTVRSATEVERTSRGAAGRNKKEQSRVVAFYLKVVRAIDTLIFRYATGNRYVYVVGATGAKKLEVWNKMIGSGRYSYDIKPDSQLELDVARDRQQKTAMYTVMAPDPLVLRAPILRDMASLVGWDPGQVVQDENVVNAQQMAQGMGIPIGQPPHGGASVNKHVQEKSGNTPNAPGAAASGDNRQERNPQRPNGPQ